MQNAREGFAGVAVELEILCLIPKAGYRFDGSARCRIYLGAKIMII